MEKLRSGAYLLEHLKNPVVFQTAAEEEHLTFCEERLERTDQLSILRVVTVVAFGREHYLIFVKGFPANIPVELEQQMQPPLHRRESPVLLRGADVIEAFPVLVIDTLKQADVVHRDGGSIRKQEGKYVRRHGVQAFPFKLALVEYFKQMIVKNDVGTEPVYLVRRFQIIIVFYQRFYPGAVFPVVDPGRELLESARPHGIYIRGKPRPDERNGFFLPDRINKRFKGRSVIRSVIHYPVKIRLRRHSAHLRPLYISYLLYRVRRRLSTVFPDFYTIYYTYIHTSHGRQLPRRFFGEKLEKFPCR